MPRLNLALPLVIRVTRPPVSNLLLGNAASVDSLNVLARMSGVARERRSLLLPSLFALYLLSFSALVFGQTLQQAPEVPAAGAKSTPEKVQAKAVAGKPAKTVRLRQSPERLRPRRRMWTKGLQSQGTSATLLRTKLFPLAIPAPSDLIAPWMRARKCLVKITRL